MGKQYLLAALQDITIATSLF